MELSKCSYLVLNTVCNNCIRENDGKVECLGEGCIYVGKRFKRGLFRSSRGVVINSDVQGGYNIMKKAIPKAFGKLDAGRIGGCGLHPTRVNLSEIELCDTLFVENEVVA